MANENLKTALKDAGLTAEEFAAIIQVDPKTVQRWVAGTATPYPRHRQATARALDTPEQRLWPDTAPSPPDDADHSRQPAAGAGDQPATAGDVTGSWGRL